MVDVPPRVRLRLARRDPRRRRDALAGRPPHVRPATRLRRGHVLVGAGDAAALAAGGVATALRRARGGRPAADMVTFHTPPAGGVLGCDACGRGGRAHRSAHEGRRSRTHRLDRGQRAGWRSTTATTPPTRAEVGLRGPRHPQAGGADRRARRPTGRTTGRRRSGPGHHRAETRSSRSTSPLAPPRRPRACC